VITHEPDEPPILWARLSGQVLGQPGFAINIASLTWHHMHAAHSGPGSWARWLGQPGLCEPPKLWARFLGQGFFGPASRAIVWLSSMMVCLL
jgi:hypothetical protein